MVGRGLRSQEDIGLVGVWMVGFYAVDLVLCLRDFNLDLGLVLDFRLQGRWWLVVGIEQNLFDKRRLSTCIASGRSCGHVFPNSVVCYR